MSEIKNLHDIFDGMTDFNIYCTEDNEIIEDINDQFFFDGQEVTEHDKMCAGFEMWHEICCNIFNCDELEDYKDKDYLEDVRDYYIIRANGEKFTFDKFAPLITLEERDGEMVWWIDGSDDFED